MPKSQREPPQIARPNLREIHQAADVTQDCIPKWSVCNVKPNSVFRFDSAGLRHNEKGAARLHLQLSTKM